MRWLIAIFLFVPGVASAADFCEAVALRNVPAIEAPDSILKRGEFDGSITSYAIVNGRAQVCSHGGYCYNTEVEIDGKLVESLVLTNCRIGRVRSSGQDGRSYDLEIIRERAAPKELVAEDADDRLLRLGVSSATAGNAGYKFANDPKSKCARVTALALRGNKLALDKMINGDDVGCD